MTNLKPTQVFMQIGNYYQLYNPSQSASNAGFSSEVCSGNTLSFSYYYDIILFPEAEVGLMRRRRHHDVVLGLRSIQNCGQGV